MNVLPFKDSYRILQISTNDSVGGAARVALNLHHRYRARGINACMAVGKNLQMDDPAIFEIPNDQYRSTFAKQLLKKAARLEKANRRGYWRFGQLLRAVAEPQRWYENWQGVEDFNFPATHHLLKLGNHPDLIQCHNLHGNYFDLRSLPRLSHKVPMVFTLHDAWLLSGHCAQHQDCERWKTGCGQCPDLTLYPKVRKDRTHPNWLRKREIFRNSKLYVITPSRWLMDQVEQSILAEGIIRSKIIPYGIDLSHFCSGDRQESRAKLGLDHNRFIVLISGSTIRERPLEDHKKIQKTLSMVDSEGESLCLILGSNFETYKAGKWIVQSLPYETDVKVVATYFKSADVLLHISKADTFPNVILQSLASGTPVIASAVGGIPEQVRSVTSNSRKDATGFLIAPNEPQLFANALESIMNDSALRQEMGKNAENDASKRFSLEQQVDEYLKFYAEILAK
jgi:glycosyltransferase involved in cell wall biosynthesis